MPRIVFVCSIVVFALPVLAVHCPPEGGEGAVKVRDLNGDGKKDYRFDAAAGVHKRTETDEAGNRKELWCLDRGAGSSFVWMYIPAAGEPCAGKNLYIGYCEFDGGGNVRTETKEKIDGKERFASTKHVNTDVQNKDGTLHKRIYEFNPRTCKLTQKSTKDATPNQEDIDRENVDAPAEDGTRVPLPLTPARNRLLILAAPEDTYVEPIDDPVQDDTSTCDINGDGKIDTNDISLIIQMRNTRVQLGDPRDPDMDGLVTANDARKCALQCTNPLCRP